MEGPRLVEATRRPRVQVTQGRSGKPPFYSYREGGKWEPDPKLRGPVRTDLVLKGDSTSCD